jgi:DNA-binding NarL/FixJ family response regulator
MTMTDIANETIRILVVDDHELVRRGVVSLLASKPNYQVISEASDGETAVEQARALQPDLVLMDMTMPRMNGLEATRLIREVAPNAEVLVISQYDSYSLVQEAMNAGARGYVLKSEAGKDLLTAIETICEHKPFISPRLTSKITY